MNFLQVQGFGFSKRKLTEEGEMEKKGKERIIEKEVCVAPDDLLTVAQAARHLGVARKKIYELVEWNELEGIKLGRSLRIKRKSLERFQASGKLT